MEDLRRTWGARIRAARIAAGLSQREVGRALNVDFATIWKWERGVMIPRDSRRAELAAVLGVTTDSLFSYDNGEAA